MELWKYDNAKNLFNNVSMKLRNLIKENSGIVKEDNLLLNPHSVLKGKTIESFKSNGRTKGYTVTFTDGTAVKITGGASGVAGDVYINIIK